MNKRHVVTGVTFEQANEWAQRVEALMPEGDEVYGTVGFPIMYPDMEVYIVGDSLYGQGARWDEWLDRLHGVGKTMFTDDSIRLMELLRDKEENNDE